MSTMVTRIGIWQAGISTPTQSMSSLIIIKVRKDFKEGLHPNLATYMHWKSNIFQKLLFLKHIHMFFLLIHRMFTSESNVYHKLLNMISLYRSLHYFSFTTIIMESLSTLTTLFYFTTTNPRDCTTLT